MNQRRAEERNKSNVDISRTNFRVYVLKRMECATPFQLIKKVRTDIKAQANKKLLGMLAWK